MECETRAILLALFCLGSLMLAYPSEYHLNHRYNSPQMVQYCGSKLAREISTICKGRYNGLMPVTTPDPFIDPQRAKTMFHTYRRRRRGIINECCNKPCSYDELRTFCAPQI